MSKKFNFQEFKSTLLPKIIDKKPCKNQFLRFENSVNIDQALLVIWDNMSWVLENDILQFINGELLSRPIGNSLDLRECTIPESLHLPKYIGGYLNLSGCILPKSLRLPEYIGLDIDLSECTIPESLQLPESRKVYT